MPFLPGSPTACFLVALGLVEAKDTLDWEPVTDAGGATRDPVEATRVERGVKGAPDDDCNGDTEEETGEK